MSSFSASGASNGYSQSTFDAAETGSYRAPFEYPPNGYAALDEHVVIPNGYYVYQSAAGTEYYPANANSYRYLHPDSQYEYEANNLAGVHGGAMPHSQSHSSSTAASSTCTTPASAAATVNAYVPLPAVAVSDPSYANYFEPNFPNAASYPYSVLAGYANAGANASDSGYYSNTVGVGVTDAVTSAFAPVTSQYDAAGTTAASSGVTAASTGSTGSAQPQPVYATMTNSAVLNDIKTQQHLDSASMQHDQVSPLFDFYGYYFFLSFRGSDCLTKR